MTDFNENVGVWIKINLVGLYRLTKMMVMANSNGYDDRAKDISLAFSNGVEVDFTLDDTNSWQIIDLVGIRDIITNYVNISIISAYPYSQKRIGFNELTVIGHASGTLAQ